MLKIRKIILTLVMLTIKCCYCKNYNNYTLFRGMPVNEQHLEFFKNLSTLYEVNYWRQPSTVFRPVEFVIPPEHKAEFVVEAHNQGVYLTTIISDVQSAFDKQTVKSYIRRNMESFDWRSYYRLEDIYSWLKDLSKMYPNELAVFSIGKTYENRDILAAKIVLKGSKRRSTAIIEGGIHAREWIGPAFVTYMINEIIHAPYSKNAELKRVAMTYEWYFVPVLNPDGYEYSHTEDRLWRKNRAQSTGVDINRNFGYGFASVGVSKNKFSDIYCGSKAFSEKESQAMAELVKAKSKKLEYYLGFHSYGQFMIVPYAHSSAHVDNFNEVKKMGDLAAKNISRRYGTKYVVGTAYDTVGYRTSGVSACWVKKTHKVPYAITFELRDSGQDGFALPINQILPTCVETMDGLVSFLTPRTKKFSKLSLPSVHGGQTYMFLDVFVLVGNVLLFIIIGYD